MTRSERYSCRIGRDAEGRVAVIAVEVEDLDSGLRRVQLNSGTAPALAGPFHDVLRAAGISGRQWSRADDIALDAVLGAHAELLLRAVKPLRRLDRIVAVAEGVATMSREEASYWHAQAFRRHGLRALRILIDGGARR
jgi:hypothetical protein